MIRSKTVFVLGAGASKEVDLPLGSELVSIISRLLTIKVNDFGGIKHAGDHEIIEICRTDRQRGKDLFRSCRLIAEGINLARSIDDFLDSHSGNEFVVEVGKLAITKAILNAERNSRLWFDMRQGQRHIEIKDVKETWYISLAQALMQNVKCEEVDRIFDNVKFVVFNYDRCLQQFLRHALCIYFGIELDKADSIVSNVSIIHPYGNVGALFGDARRTTLFGAADEIGYLRERASRIKTYTEQTNSVEDVEDMRTAISEAEVLVFLGFGFHRQNLDLIIPPDLKQKSNSKRIYGTVCGESEPNVSEIYSLMQSKFPPGKHYPRPDVTLAALTCSEFLSSYWRALTR